MYMDRRTDEPTPPALCLSTLVVRQNAPVTRMAVDSTLLTQHKDKTTEIHILLYSAKTF